MDKLVMTLRGGSVMEFIALAATSRGGEKRRTGRSFPSPGPCRIAGHRALGAHSCGALSSRWQGRILIDVAQIAQLSAALSPHPLLVAAKAKNSTTQPSRSVICLNLNVENHPLSFQKKLKKRRLKQPKPNVKASGINCQTS